MTGTAVVTQATMYNKHHIQKERVGSVPAPPHPLIRVFFYLFAASIPFQVLDVGSSKYFSLSKLIGIIFGLVVFLLAGKKMLSRPPKAFRFFLAYVLVMVLVGLAGGDYLDEMIRRFIQLIQMLILLLFGFHLLQNPWFSRRVFIAFSLSAFVLVSFVPIGGDLRTVHQWGSVERVGVLNWSLNSLGAVLAVAGVALIGVTFDGFGKRGFKNKLLVLSILAFITLNLARTGSRSGMLALLMGTMVVFLRASKTVSAKIKTVGAVLSILIIVMGLFSYSETARVRWMATIQRYDLAHRQDIFSASIETFLERPFFGWGPGRNVEVIGAKVDAEYVDAHNSLLWALTETGIVGAVLFLIGVLLCLRSAWLARKGPNGILPLALLVTVIVINSSITAIYMKFTWLIFAFALASDPTLSSKFGRPAYQH